jgi:DNA-directed RNA polymerase subunit RPC12/RpoP
MGERMRKYTCVLCGGRFEGWGNNPAPITNRGRCCDECNWRIVIPIRLLLSQLYEHRGELRKLLERRKLRIENRRLLALLKGVGAIEVKGGKAELLPRGWDFLTAVLKWIGEIR